MPDEESDENTCEFRLSLLPFRGSVTTWFDRKTGMQRSMVLLARVDDPYLGGPSFSAPHFHEKPVRLEISSPPDSEWLSEVNTKLGAAESFGRVRVKKNVETEQLCDDGEKFEVEPIRIRLDIPPDVFEAIHSQAIEAYRQRHLLWANVTLVGEKLPSVDTELGILFLQDLDVSEDREYAVGRFEIFDTRYTFELPKRVDDIWEGFDENYLDSIEVVLSRARYSLRSSSGRISGLSCEGRVTNVFRQDLLDGTDVYIDFLEHEFDSVTGELPDRAYAGEFLYIPKEIDDPISAPSLSLRLRYVPGDDRDLIVPLLSQEIGTRLSLECSLIVEREKLREAVNQLQGNVKSYGFKVIRDLKRDGA